MDIQLVEELRCKTEGHGFDTLWSHWEFLLVQHFPLQKIPGVDSDPNRNK